jgi:hypothetical protein
LGAGGRKDQEGGSKSSEYGNGRARAEHNQTSEKVFCEATV